MHKLDAGRIAALKLHNPIATYTSHPFWQQLSGPHCSFKEACSLLAAGLAAEFLEQAPSRKAARHAQQQRGRAAAAASPAAAQGGTAAGAAAAAAAAGDGHAYDSESTDKHTESNSPKRGSPKRGKYITSWLGLEPLDSGTYSLPLSESVVNQGRTTIPGAPDVGCSHRCTVRAGVALPGCKRGQV